MRVLFSVIIIAQSGAGNIEYLISWLQKISLEKPYFEYGTFSKPLVFKDGYLSGRTSLFVL